MVRLGPMIEGVVSPTASKTTINNALNQAATPGTQVDQNRYTSISAGVDAGLNQTQLGQLATSYDATNYPNPALQPMPAPTTSPYGGGAGGRSAYTDAEIAYMVGGGGGGSVAPTSTGGGGGGGSGGGSGDGGGSGGGGAGTAPESGTLGDVSKEAIDAQINSLTAQYGLDLASLAALGGEIGRQAQFLMAQLNRDQGFAQEDLMSNMVQRGIFKSGITARDTGRLMGDFAQQRARVEMDKGSRLRQLAERAGAASAALGRGKADVIGNIDKGNLGAELRQSLLNELNSLTPADIQNALNAAYSGNQQSLTDLMQKGAGGGGIDFNQGMQTAGSYGGGQVVGGYNIDPATGLATGTGGQTQQITPETQSAGQIAPGVGGLTPEQLALLTQEYDSDMGMTPANALGTAITGY